MPKIIVFVALLLMYPFFLKWVHITDLRAVPLIIPYALGVLSLIILGSELLGLLLRKRRRDDSSES
jgi:amino acid transporter